MNKKWILAAALLALAGTGLWAQDANKADSFVLLGQTYVLSGSGYYKANNGGEFAVGRADMNPQRAAELYSAIAVDPSFENRQIVIATRCENNPAASIVATVYGDVMEIRKHVSGIENVWAVGAKGNEDFREAPVTIYKHIQALCLLKTIRLK